MTDAFMEERTPLVAIRSANVNRDGSQLTSSGLSPTKPVKSVNQVLPRARLSFDSNASLSIQDDKIGLIPIARTSMPPPNAANHDHVIYCRKSIALLLGRARAVGQDEEDEALQSQETRDAVGGIPAIRIALPNTARHVSRDHCIIYHTPFGGSSWAVKILGQNGLIVDGKRHRAGSILRVRSGQTLIDFFGGVRALFLGDGHSTKQSNVHANAKVQDGRSPSKKLATARVSLGQKGDELRNAAAQVVSGQKNGGESRKYIGNVQKRPAGAPLSPPTSSPAPFDASSSPSLARSVFGKRQSLLPSSSPNNANEEIEEDNEDEEEDEEMLNSPRATSPTLQRRANKSSADDSGVLMCEIDDNQQGISTPIESEDEASQALQATSKQSAKMHKRTISLANKPKSSRSPNGTPQRTIRDPKKVKFNKDSRSGTPTATPASTNKTAATLHPARMQAIQTHFRALVGILAESYDLQGLLAGAIVFHRTATISATEAVRSVLSSNPGLMRGEVGPDGGENVKVERGSILSGWTYDNLIENKLIKTEEADKERVEIWQRKAWRERLEDCLMEGECFGIIQRAGKDASGNPLECWYYYDKELDPDSQRAANLGAFVKPMRAALKTHKPIFWRKSAYGTTSDDVKALQMQEGQQQQLTAAASNLIGGASESQWGSSGSTLNSALLTSQQPNKNEQKAADNARQQSVKRVWEETQFEENEQTWDKEGDLDFEVSNGRRIKRKK
ncbi:uncharacterized protein FA14DRAFT_191027 [Meira miltonrushii]|uniref:FHA domain-containing protein n=1 Tax=Meira miltonrushii TaxID=1280837 RepID=A0A316VEK7_9BASI|nr:uncharacterized protein FA14DRAFT_191027 [Meira miltonrushii]PWN33915.1 hypothetical protein FA14DRAFT_191027 [Meira miltonrushii]